MTRDTASAIGGLLAGFVVAALAFLEPPAHLLSFCAALTRFDPMISRWISLVPSYKRNSRTSR